MKPFPDSLMCPDCNGYDKVIKTAENAWQPGPLGFAVACAFWSWYRSVKR